MISDFFTFTTEINFNKTLPGRIKECFDVSTVISLLLPWSVETTRTSGAVLLVEATEDALEAASRIIKAFLGDVNEVERVCSWSLETLESKIKTH